MPWLILIAAAGALAAVGNRGFELTDESYYLYWIATPQRFPVAIHPFGFFLHPVFAALGGSLVALRLFGLALLIGSAFVLGHEVDHYYRRVGYRLSFDPRAWAGIFSLLHYGILWILTPGYNLLTNCGGSIVLAGALRWSARDRLRRRTHEDDIGALLVGVGGSIAFFAKPTFAALAAAAIVAQLALSVRTEGSRVASRRAVLTALCCAVTMVGFAALSGGPSTFVQALSGGARTLDFGNGLATLPMRTWRELAHPPRPLAGAMLILGGMVAWRLSRQWPERVVLARLAGAFALAGGLAYFARVTLGMIVARGDAWPVLAVPTTTVIVATMALGIAGVYRDRLRGSLWWPIGVLSLMPLAMAFGTANALIPQTIVSGFALLLAVTIAADLLFGRAAALAIRIAAGGYVMMLLAWSAGHPYGLPEPITAQVEPTRFQPTGEVLLLDPQTRRYVLRMQFLRETLRPAADTPVVDLSGGGPATALLLNGNPPFFPWIVPIYGERSRRLADQVWRSLTPELQRRAWFVGPVAPALSDSLPARFLIDRSAGYARHAAGPMRFRSGPLDIVLLVPRPFPTPPSASAQPAPAGLAR